MEKAFTSAQILAFPFKKQDGKRDEKIFNS